MWRFGVFLLVLFAFVSTHVQARQTPEFNLSNEPARFVCADQRPGARGAPEGGTFGFSGQPYVLTRLESRTLSGSDSPALTIASDPNNTITIVGKEQRDFSLQYCGRGGGANEAEARLRLGAVGMTLNRDIVSINNPGPPDNLPGGSLLLEAPANALTVTHATSSAVEVRNMSGPVRVDASRARATILNTTGQVDVEALHIDFAGSRGNVKLRSNGNLRLAMTTTKFDGTMEVDAMVSIQIFVPAKFQTPFRVFVNNAEDFVCRTDICSNVKRTRQGQVYIFTYPGDGSAPPERFSVRPYLLSTKAPAAKVVIDSLSEVNVKLLETSPAPKQ